MIRPSILLVCAAALVLCGCGKQGDLERPAPLWGAKAKADYAAEQKAAADAKAKKNKRSQPQPPPVDENGLPADSDPAPARENPIPGAKSDPFGSAPSSALPDPSRRPQ